MWWRERTLLGSFIASGGTGSTSQVQKCRSKQKLIFSQQFSVTEFLVVHLRRPISEIREIHVVPSTALGQSALCLGHSSPSGQSSHLLEEGIPCRISPRNSCFRVFTVPGMASSGKYIAPSLWLWLHFWKAAKQVVAEMQWLFWWLPFICGVLRTCVFPIRPW